MVTLNNVSERSLFVLHVSLTQRDENQKILPGNFGTERRISLTQEARLPGKI